MKRVNKLSIALVAGICSLLIILSAKVLVSPWFLDNTRVKNKICSEVSRLISGEFRYDKTSLSLFPIPHIVLVKPQIDIPDAFSASVESIELFPDLIKLLSGRLGFKKTVINRPNATIWITQAPADTQIKSNAVESRQMISHLLHSLSRLPKLFLAIDEGTISNASITLITNQTTTAKLDSFNAVIQNRSETLTFKITSSSNIFDNLTLTGAIQTNQPNGHAHLELGKLKLETLYNLFLPEASQRVVDGDADIGVDLNLQNNNAIDVTLKGSVPSVYLGQANQAVEIEVQSVAARININPVSTTITLSDLQLGNPSMQVSGNFNILDQSPRLNAQLEVRNIDIDLIRSVSLALAGSNSVTQAIFEIIKNGSIPLLTLSSQADTARGLADLDNLVLQTSLTNGTIDVPGTSMALTGVSGDVGIKKGVLSGKHVVAQRQKSTVKDGILKIDLTRDPLPLDMTADLTIDVADIPGILQSVVQDQTLNDELKMIVDLKGNAAAALSLTGSTDQLKLSVSASDFHLAARYKHFPFLLRIDSGEVAYDGNQIKWRRLKGLIGSSSFTTFSGNLDLGENKNFEITSGSSNILVSEFLPWIALELKKPEIINYYVGGKSILHLPQVTMEGSLKDFRDWHFNIAGEMEDLKVFADVSRDKNEVIFKKLTIKDDISQASMSGRYMEPILTVNYDGQFNASTLNRFFLFSKNPSVGVVEGQAQMHFNLKNAHDVSFAGKLNGKNIFLPTSTKTPLLVKNIQIDATSETVLLESFDLGWSDINLNLSGSITPNFPKKPMIDLDVETDSIDLEKLLAKIRNEHKAQGEKSTATNYMPAMPVVGTVHFKAKNIETNALTIQPLQADIKFQDEATDITLLEMGVCGITTSGTIKGTPQDVRFQLKPEAQGQQLKATLNCLAGKHIKADGTLQLSGVLDGHGTIDELLKSSSGKLSLSVSNGHIYQDIILINVLKFLNVTEVLTGRLSPGQMREKGVGFDRFEAQIELQQGKLKCENFIFDGDEIKLSGTGEIDMFTKVIKFTLLVTTQKTAGTLLGHVPLVGDALQTMTTIPLTVKGTFDDIHVLPLAPSAIGYELLEITKKTLGIPLNLVHLRDIHKRE